MEIGTVNFDDLFDFSPEPQQVAQQDAAEARENDAIARLQDNNENKNYYTLQPQQQQQPRLQDHHQHQHQQQQQQQYQGLSGSGQQQQQQIGQYNSSSSYCTSTPQGGQVYKH